MPRLAGDDALRIMKAVKPQIPIVTVTGHVGRGEMAETVKLGAVACLAKPYTMDQLRQAVDPRNFGSVEMFTLCWDTLRQEGIDPFTMSRSQATGLLLSSANSPSSP